MSLYSVTDVGYMKVYIGKYKNHWVSPYKIIEKVFFWKDWDNISYDEPWVERLADILDPFCQSYNYTMEKFFPRKVKIRIDYWDTWNMDDTLSLIILPMLKQLKETKHGSAVVDDQDVPDHIKSSDVHDRWDWVMNEMIWAFEQINNDDYDDVYFVDGQIDVDKMKEVEDRISNGLRLFGKYYRGLWD